MNIRTPLTTACLAALSLASVASPARAQTGYFAPALSAGIVYDSNTTSTSTTEEPDWILRVTPELEGGWRSARGSFVALHTFDMERYRDNSRFDDAQIRRTTVFDADYRLTERLDFAGSASAAATDAPGDLVPELGLEFGRADARRYTADAELAYRLSPRTTTTVAAGWTHDEVATGTETTTALAGVGASLVAGPRHTWTADYVFRRYEFEDRPTVDAHIALLGWETALSPRAALAIQAGPRYTDGGDTSPEVFVTSTYDLPDGSLSLNFARTQSTVLGQRGLADSHVASLNFMRHLNADLVLRLMPSWSELERAGRTVEVVRAFAELRWLMNRNLSLRGSYQWSRQDGSLDSPLPLEIDRNVVFVGATWEFNPQPMSTETTPRRRR